MLELLAILHYSNDVNNVRVPLRAATTVPKPFLAVTLDPRPVMEATNVPPNYITMVAIVGPLSGGLTMAGAVKLWQAQMVWGGGLMGKGNWSWTTQSCHNWSPGLIVGGTS